jgi:protein-tyrosine phosphatase
MIDIHSHILPGLDDGPKTLDDALRMCEIARDDGITTIVATPHNLNGIYQNEREHILGETESLNEALRQRGFGINILPGSDTRLDVSLQGMLMEGRVMTINDTGKFLLIELSPFFVADQVKQQLFELSLTGVTPVISHPERNETLMDNLDVLRYLIQMGALVQITAGSVTGHFGRKVEKRTMRLLRLNMVHILATDAHNYTSRPPALSRALEVISKKIGDEEARGLVQDTPQAIISGIKPTIKEPLKEKRRSFFPLSNKDSG